MKALAILLAVPGAAGAADASFDAAWEQARRSLEAPHPYLATLDEYYGADTFTAEACDRGLRGAQQARVILHFDATGKFSIDAESTSDVLEACLRETFTANPPPVPPQLPLSLAYEFRRDDPR